VDTNGNVIVAGTDDSVVFWDVRNTKVPMEILEESHNQDVTSVKFHPKDPQKVLSCGIDSLLNFYDFEGKSSMKEDDTVDTVYCSE
jgi:WD40 repeat protein